MKWTWIKRLFRKKSKSKPRIIIKEIKVSPKYQVEVREGENLKITLLDIERGEGALVVGENLSNKTIEKIKKKLYPIEIVGIKNS